MICDECRTWCATTEAQLAGRIRNMQVGGEPFPCPVCSGTDWASSREMIGTAPLERAFWRTWIKPPSWRVTVSVQLVMAVAMTGMAVFMTDIKWIVIADAVGAGLNLGLAFNTWQMARAFLHMQQLKQAFDSMCEINTTLVRTDIGAMVLRMSKQPDEDMPPVAPNKMH